MKKTMFWMLEPVRVLSQRARNRAGREPEFTLLKFA